MPPKSKNCQHRVLQLDVSPFAELAGYAQPTEQKRAAAETTSGRIIKGSSTEPIQTFPAPLVLPHDHLNYDPDYPPQSVKSWFNEKARNRLTNKTRNTLYIASVPNIREEVEFMHEWRAIEDSNSNIDVGEIGESPQADMFVDYLKAFYHGMDARLLPTSLSWTTWGKSSQPTRQDTLPKYVGLAYDENCTRIRVRKAPDGTFGAQLNLNDIIDAAMRILPDDAYAILLLVDHDIYEGDDDDFCCGRAYGGSRVAVVQTARYSPKLDARKGIDRTHMWPLSHCKDFVDTLCAVEEVEPQKATRQQISSSKNGPMKAAVDAAKSRPDALDLEQDYVALWFSRMARTVVHEFGHCFGMDHCVYYACNMQGTAGMKEDVRQPPYLCPVCESKVGQAIVAELQSEDPGMKRLWVKERCSAMIQFCDRLEKSGMDTAMWRGLNAWTVERSKIL